MNKGFTPATALGLVLALSACGGGDGGVESTPEPVASYNTLDQQLEKGATFQTAGISTTSDSTYNIVTKGKAFGSGVTISYASSTDTYTLTSPDGRSVNIAPENYDPSSSSSGTKGYKKVDGSNTDYFSFSRPGINNVAMTYVFLGSWLTINQDGGYGSSSNLMIGGVPTRSEDLPQSGTATYSTSVDGIFVKGDDLISLSNPETRQLYSSASFSINFANGAVSTDLNLSGYSLDRNRVQDLGVYSGTGVLASGGPGFAGTLSGVNATGEFSGALFGPKAAEMGYVWYLNGPDLSGNGFVVGKKN